VTACVLAKNGDFAGTQHWQTSYEVWSSQIFGGLLSFVLSWTLSYALVHGMTSFTSVADMQYMIEYGMEKALGIVIGDINSMNLEFDHFLPSEILRAPNPSANPTSRPQGGSMKRRGPPFFSANSSNAVISSFESSTTVKFSLILCGVTDLGRTMAPRATTSQLRHHRIVDVARKSRLD
jgi:hypothetical protein